MNWKVESRYRVDKLIGIGSFGQIYTGHDIVNNEEVAIKIECKNCKYHQLENEYKVYQNISSRNGIPKLKCFIVQNNYRILVMELLGPNLEDFYQYCDRKLSLQTVLNLGIQMIQLIEYLHNKGYIHRDIKPSNFVMGLGKNAKTVYLIDFGLAKPYCDAEDGNHVKMSVKCCVVGTLRFGSLNNHLGNTLSRRDDLEQLCYTLIYLLNGHLPWQGQILNIKYEKYRRICLLKSMNIPNLFTKLQVLTYMHWITRINY